MKTYNFNPGPTPVPDHITQKMAEPILSHRSSEFSNLLDQISQNLKYVFQTRNDVITLTASGSGAMETAVVNLLNSGDRVLAIRSGKFGGRWVELCEVYGMDVIVVDVEWGQAVDPDIIREALADNGPFKAVLATHSETSTGVLHDIESIGKITHEMGCFLVVDAISSLGANELRTDDWHIDMVVSGSQKGLMIPPGLSFISVSEQAWSEIKLNKTPSYYLNLMRAKESYDKNLTPYTPAVSLIMGLAEALEDIKRIGLENIFQHHERLAQITRAGVKYIGLELFAKQPSNVLSSVEIPGQIDGNKLLKTIRTDCGVTIANGMGVYKDKICRISHLGYHIDACEMLIAISALEYGLKKHGFPFQPGAGVGAAQRMLLEG